MMSQLEYIVEQVAAAFEARRRLGWSVTALPLTGEDKELERWRGLVEARLKTFRHSAINRSLLLGRVRYVNRVTSETERFSVASYRVTTG